MWTDLFLDRIVGDAELTHGLAQVFGVGSSDVYIIDDIGTAVAEDASSRPVRVERVLDGGDFSLRVSVFRELDLRQRIENRIDEEAAIAMLCALWRSSCSFSDDDANPYAWLLMRPTGLLEAVTVDADQLDEQDELVIARVDRAVRQVPVVV